MPVSDRARLLFAPLALLALLPPAALARMYQWVDPGTGTVQLSGAPPAWYRGKQAGPRVFVFENGRLVDDTGTRVADDEAQALRAEAFGPAPSPGPMAGSPLQAPMFASPAAAVSDAAAGKTADDSTSARIAEFKSLLEAYDDAQGAAARDTLEDAARAALPPAGLSAPSP